MSVVGMLVDDECIVLFCCLYICGVFVFFFFFFFQAEDGIRDLVRSRGLGDVYKRQERWKALHASGMYRAQKFAENLYFHEMAKGLRAIGCLLYTSDAADDLLCVDLGGRRIIKKKKQEHIVSHVT